MNCSDCNRILPIVVMADEDGDEEFDKLDHIINSSGCAKELELSKGSSPH